jgi:hypothetical protein
MAVYGTSNTFPPSPIHSLTAFHMAGCIGNVCTAVSCCCAIWWSRGRGMAVECGDRWVAQHALLHILCSLSAPVTVLSCLVVQERLHGVQAMFANKLVDRLVTACVTVSVSGGMHCGIRLICIDIKAPYTVHPPIWYLCWICIITFCDCVRFWRIYVYSTYHLSTRIGSRNVWNIT